MAISPSGATVWRDYSTDGVPASGAHKVQKSQVRAWSQSVEDIVSAAATAALVFDTRANLYATLTASANTLAWVVNDTTVAYNGIYRKSGASGAGSWARVADLPYSVIVASDVGAGTANAIQATTPIPVSESALVLLNVFEANTASPVTVSFNGGAALTIKTNSGNDVSSGGLVAGMLVVGRVAGSTFRLASDQASAAVLAAAESAAESASDYADFARNNWVVMGPFTGTGGEEDYFLSTDPGSENNMFVLAEGVGQMIGAYSLVYVGGLPHIRISLPSDVEFEVRVSNAIPVNTPGDGSVGYTKLSSGIIHDAPDKVTPVDADEFSLWDSAATAILKRLTFANLKAALKSYFDTIYNNQPISEWVAYTPTFTGFGTVSGVSFFSRRVGDSLEVRGTFASGTSTATEARITLGFDGTNANVTTADTSKLPARSTCGTVVYNLNSASAPSALAEPSRGYLLIGLQSASTNGYQPANGNSIASSGTAISINANVPISGW